MPIQITATDVERARRAGRGSTDDAGMPVEPVTGALSDYVALTDVALRRRTEPARGLYIAESEKVIRRALAAIIGRGPCSWRSGGSST